jgi:predicted ATP-dependent endonuclease of OLD family
MIIITNIEIEKFRSCRSLHVKDCGNFNILSGRNNSGKSNILRALSLFFKNEIEEGELIDLSRDCNSREKEKKKISIALSFKLDEKLKIQQTIQDVAELIKRDCRIKKEYVFNKTDISKYQILYYLNDKLLEEKEKQLVEQFLHLFNFRYIQSNKTALNVLTENLKELQSELKFRYRSKYRDENIRKDLDKKQKDSIDVIKSLATQILKPISDEMVKADQTIVDVNIGTPNEIVELLNTVSYQIKLKSGVVLNEKFQGNGMQSILLYSILYLIDRNYHRKFGWKIATVWAIEEPESFLHFDLENQLANYFSENAGNLNERFQIFSTTHSNVFPQYADAHYLVEKKQEIINNYWTECKKMNMHEFLFKLQELNISASVNILSLYPMEKIIILEGERDEYIFSEIVKTLGLQKIKVFSISRLLNDQKRVGDTQIELLINSNINIIKRRTVHNYIIMIFDWDKDKKKINKLTKRITTPNKIIQLDIEKRTKLLDKSFRGIEAFYPIEYIQELHNANPGLISDRGGKLSKDRYFVDPTRYDLVKDQLYGILKNKGVKSDYLTNLVKSITL